jgi:SAM-dependent methyltransferase
MLVDNRIVAALKSGENFIELGCGCGAIISECAPMYVNSVGIDFSDAQSEHIGRQQNWSFIKADLNDVFPIESSWADCIVANQVIEHIYNPLHFSREVFRCLRPGGRVIVTTPNIRTLKNLWWMLTSGYGPRTAGGHTLDGEWDDGHIHYFTHREIQEIFRAAGFSKVMSRALVNISHGGRMRGIFDRWSDMVFIREFVAGNILLIADK